MQQVVVRKTDEDDALSDGPRETTLVLVEDVPSHMLDKMQYLGKI